MKIPITKFGLPEVVLYPLGVLGVMLLGMGLYWIAPLWVWIVFEGIGWVVVIWMLSFFRDPPRKCPRDAELLLSPADGKISDICEISAEESPLGVDSLRIGIFLNVFNVHINRMPCAVEVERVEYHKGQFKNALDPESARVNESNDVYLRRLEEPCDRLLVRQISGAIARRIVSKAEPGKKFSSGRRFGMIKFGSRTELYVPVRANLDCKVNSGDKVKAGLTVVARYRGIDGTQ